MKILKLTLKNINSLVGTHTIDFEKIESYGEGVFSISGKTGAGKSSILDAICLALYGQTPRLNITKENNEIMTRGEKDCMAEVVFAVKGQVYSAHFSHARTRNITTFSEVKRYIADANNNILAEKATPCNAKIVEITSLTFEQFTKVILLAQGSFAEFLNSKNEDKAALLEKITDGGIYREISKRSQQRSSEAKAKYIETEKDIERYKVLEKNELQALQQEIKALESSVNKATAESKQLAVQQQIFESILNKQTEIATLNQILPQQKQACDDQNAKLKKIATDVKNTEQLLKNEAKIWNQVRELDTQIKGLNHQIISQNSELQKAQANLEKHQKAQQELATLKQKATQNLAKNHTWSKDNGHLQTLPQQFSKISADYDSCKAEKQQIDEHNNLLQKAEIAVQAATEALAKHEAQVKQDEVQQKTMQKAKDDWQSKIAQLLTESDDVNFYRDRKDQLANHISIAQRLNDNLKQQEKLVEEHNANTQLLANTEKAFKAQNTEQKSLQKKIVEQEKLVAVLQEEVQKAHLFKNLEAQRKNLKHGTECPLCGSLEHPWAENHPESSQAEEKLKISQQQHKELNEQLAQLGNTIAGIEVQRTTAQRQESDLATKIKDATKASETLLAQLSDIPASFKLSEKSVAKLLKDWETAQTKNDSLLKEHAAVEKQLNKATTDLNLLELQISRAKATTELLKGEIKTHEQEAKNCTKNTQAAQSKYDALVQQITTALQKYQVAKFAELHTKLQEWENNQAQKELLTQQNSDLDVQIAKNTTELKTTQTKLSEIKAQIALITDDLNKLSGKRRELYGEKDPETEENKLTSQLENLKQQHQETEQKAQQFHAELAKIEHDLQRLAQELDAATAKNTTGQTPTPESLAALHTKDAELDANINHYNTEIGAKKQVLTQNESNLSKRKELAQTLAAQKIEWDKWNMLDELIGHNKGDKFSKYVQAITFNHLVVQANQYIQTMGKRYTIIYDFASAILEEKVAFDLSVCDHFQNDEIRPVQNLSGGEKFVLSLSLALGLASLVGDNITVETLFIDEGFGTLDGDYLNTVFDALSKLQSQGKTIGIISHSPQLKESTPTCLEVEPAASGLSTITCTRAGVVSKPPATNTSKIAK